MTEHSSKSTLVISIIALIVSIVTLVLTSPVLIDLYLTSEVEYSVLKLSRGSLRLDISNSGRRPASTVVIEIAPRHPDNYEQINIDKVVFIPPKEHEIMPQEVFKLIKLKSPILPGENVAVIIYADIPDVAYAFLWIRVTYDGKEANKTGSVLE